MAKAMMPTTIKVGVHTYRVLRKSPKLDKDENGKCDVNALEIIVRQRLKKSKAQEILVHEIDHAIIWQSLPRVETFTEEQIVEATASVRLQVTRDNPELYLYLIS